MSDTLVPNSDDVLKAYSNDLELFQKDLNDFCVNHNAYVKKLEETERLKTQYSSQFNRFQRRLTAMQRRFSEISKERNSSLSEQQLSSLNDISACLTKSSDYLRRINDTLPKEPETYLKIVLGPVPISILDKAQKWKYKEEYEKFKFVVSIIILAASLFLIMIDSTTLMDSLFHFLLVWYYCTLTIRESILIVNGSQIKPWWRIHHFIACMYTGIILIWPDSQSYHVVRKRLFLFCFYITFVQTLQFYYQRGLLYRLRALGEKKEMDITFEGFHAWMLRGLGFLVPFLVIGYALQLLFAYWLFKLYNEPFCNEWHVLALSILMFVLFVGNVATASVVLKSKLSTKVNEFRSMATKYEGFISLLNFLNEHQDGKLFDRRKKFC